MTKNWSFEILERTIRFQQNYDINFLLNAHIRMAKKKKFCTRKWFKKKINFKCELAHSKIKRITTRSEWNTHNGKIEKIENQCHRQV